MKISFKQNKEKDRIEMLEIKQNKQMSKQGYDQKKKLLQSQSYRICKTIYLIDLAYNSYHFQFYGFEKGIHYF